MRRIAAVLAAACAVTAAAAGAVPALASHQAPATPRFYYLSLGDSLSQGVQPTASGADAETTAGYPDQLFTALHMGNPLLHLVKLGCPGETTASMIKGGLCTYQQGSQLAQAAAFLKNHRGHVQLVTMDIGANDLNPCVVLTNLAKLVKCLEKVIPVAVKNLAAILGTLRGASQAPVPMIGMSYYVPELAGWLKGTKPARALAKDSIALGQAFNNDLGKVYAKFSVPVADVFKAFHTTDFKDRVVLAAFGRVPKDVAYICSYTWECAAPPRGPNEHANRLGYAVIANTFLDTYLSLAT